MEHGSLTGCLEMRRRQYKDEDSFMRLRMIKSGAQETTNSQGPMGAERAEQMKDKEWS